MQDTPTTNDATIKPTHNYLKKSIKPIISYSAFLKEFLDCNQLQIDSAIHSIVDFLYENAHFLTILIIWNNWIQSG
jgi:hypothetical protein